MPARHRIIVTHVEGGVPPVRVRQRHHGACVPPLRWQGVREERGGLSGPIEAVQVPGWLQSGVRGGGGHLQV